MPKIKRKAIYDPVAERKKWTEHFRDRYLSIFLAKWGIEGATEEEDRFSKRTLYLDGKISAWRASDDLVVFSPFAPQGFNIYGSPLSGLPIRLQGADFFPDKPLNTYALRNNEARGVDEPEIVLGYALPNKKSVFSQIEALVQERVEIAMAKATNRIGCKIPMLLLTTPENRKALEQFASDVLNDEAIVSIGVTEVDGISCVNTGIPYFLDKFEAYDQNLDGKILSMLGVDNSGARKMEREVVDEVNSNNALINLASEAFKNEVSGFFDRVNGAFGKGYRLVDKMPKVDSFHDGAMENGEEENKEDREDEVR